MIPYSHSDEKKFILHYAGLLNDSFVEEIISRDVIENKEEALHLADFFWRMVDRSNEEDKKTGENSEYVLEKIINTFMAYFNSAGFEGEWEAIVDLR